MQEGPERHFSAESELRRYESILLMADCIVHHQDMAELFSGLGKCLKKLYGFELNALSLHDPVKNLMRVHILNANGLAPISEDAELENVASGWVWQNQQPLIIPDTKAESRFPASMTCARRTGIRSMCILPLTTGQRRLGRLGFGSTRANAYRANDVRLLQRVADLVALAVENTQIRSDLQQEKDRLRMLLEVNASLVSSHDLQELFPAIAGFIRVIKQEFASIALHDDSQSLSVYALDYPGG